MVKHKINTTADTDKLRTTTKADTETQMLRVGKARLTMTAI